MDEIRTLHPDEMDQSIALSCFAFQYELSPSEWEERKTRMKPDRTWGYFVGGTLAAKMSIHDLRMYVQGKPYPMGGVASVATWPEYRRKGMVDKLLRTGLEAMRRDGHSFSCLHPFSVSFYRKYGWELFTDYKTYELTSGQLPKNINAPGRMVRAEGDWKLLNRVYDRYAQLFNGMIARDESWWEHTVFKQKGKQAAVYLDEKGEPQGYVIYKAKNRVMEIGEMAFLDETARTGLWRFIADHDSMCETYKLQAPADDDLPFLLPDPRVRQETIPYFMARIVDFERFAEQYAFTATGERQRLTVRLSDETAVWNDAVFRLTVDGGGKASVERIADELPMDEFATATRCDIGAMSAMLMGYKRPDTMYKTGRLVGAAVEIEKWEKLIPRQRTYLSDYY